VLLVKFWSNLAERFVSLQLSVVLDGVGDKCFTLDTFFPLLVPGAWAFAHQDVWEFYRLLSVANWDSWFVSSILFCWVAARCGTCGLSLFVGYKYIGLSFVPRQSRARQSGRAFVGRTYTAVDRDACL
jgi:hypothetical protein